MKSSIRSSSILGITNYLGRKFDKKFEIKQIKSVTDGCLNYHLFWLKKIVSVHLCYQSLLLSHKELFNLNRTATTWNLLPSEIVGTDTVNQFKAKIDRHMKSETWRRSVYRI
ncbi:hypothetical protein BpHYR1_026279 [Brachionus plicatilis]|uniref:RNA-directed DNA polymerase from mobile element jockey-like n=1 Tax=Brachionus plicatilis TaxID=10195 RepID=A0A3M7QWB8_BRAPC|nr:hypothetical protein BpHYR1_026279 [Brachionus plicatilis]